MTSNKLYVGGLPSSVTDDKLQEIFSPHGTVESARVITDRMTGRSRGRNPSECQPKCGQSYESRPAWTDRWSPVKSRKPCCWATSYWNRGAAVGEHIAQDPL